MGKKQRDITTNTMPHRICPHCGAQVVKTIRYGQLSYECRTSPCNRWGPWEESLKRPTQSDASAKPTFCRACGASIPHIPGEGRCPECMHHAS